MHRSSRAISRRRDASWGGRGARRLARRLRLLALVAAEPALLERRWRGLFGACGERTERVLSPRRHEVCLVGRSRVRPKTRTTFYLGSPIVVQATKLHADAIIGVGSSPSLGLPDDMVHRLLICAIALVSLPSSDALTPTQVDASRSTHSHHRPNAARLPPPHPARRRRKELTTQSTQTQKKVDAKRNKLKLYLMCAAIAASWFVFATLFFSRSGSVPLAQSFFFTVDTGMGIGFGAVEEQLQRTRVFTIINALVGASAVGGALALFADNIVAESSTVAAQEFASAALNGAFTRADTSGDGQLGRDELKAALKGLDVAVGAQDLDEAMKKFDTNGDGSLCRRVLGGGAAPSRPRRRGARGGCVD